MALSENQITHVCQALNASGAPYVVIGGLALSLWGDPRLTYDIDFLVYLTDEKDVKMFLSRGVKEGLSFDMNEALRTFKTHRAFVGKEGDLHLDFLVAGTAYETELYERRRQVMYAGLALPVASPEDMILLKLMAGRDKDLVDIKNIIARQGLKLDKAYITKWAEQFHSKKTEKQFLKTIRNLLG
jgi:predicted nucleotidyltransferase